MYCVKDCHVTCHGLSCIVSRIIISCVKDCHVLLQNCHVLCNELSYLYYGFSCFVSRIVMFCVTDCHVLRHCLSCLVSRIVTFCVTDYVLGFDLCSVAVYIKASAEHISSIFMVKYAPL